jgi:hypothetical protein
MDEKKSLSNLPSPKGLGFFILVTSNAALLNFSCVAHLY